MSHLINIKKHLPGGRVVNRQVSQDEFINQWYKTGWEANTVDADVLAKEAQRKIDEEEFKKLTEGKNISTLRSYMAPIKIFKTLPTGKRVYRRLYKGEYELKGWKDQGWRPTYGSSEIVQKPKPIYSKQRQKILRDLHNMRWWRPQRPDGYARSISRSSQVPFLPYNSSLLKNPNYMLNPRYKTYTRRVRNYAHNHPTWNAFTRLPNVTRDETNEYWDRIKKEFNRVKKTKTPNPIIKYKNMGWDY